MIFKVEKLVEDLEYWIFIGMADDIIECPRQRIEYQHYVDKYRDRDYNDIPKLVLADLKKEVESFPWYKRPTFWKLIILNFKKVLRII